MLLNSFKGNKKKLKKVLKNLVKSNQSRKNGTKKVLFKNI